MAVVVGRNRLAVAAALATLAGVLGLVGGQPAVASPADQHGQSRPVAPTWTAH